MYPELFHIGRFPVNTYGVLLALAFLAALFVAARLGARDGLARERVFDLGLWMLLGGLVGELAHRITGVPVGVHLHPTQLYESAACAVIFLLLFRLHRRKRFDGEVIAAYAVLYGLTRFLIEFVRDDPRGDIAGLTTLTGLSTSQLVSIIVVIAGIVFLFLRRRRANRERAASGDEAQAADTASA